MRGAVWSNAKHCRVHIPCAYNWKLFSWKWISFLELGAIDCFNTNNILYKNFQHMHIKSEHMPIKYEHQVQSNGPYVYIYIWRLFWYKKPCFKDWRNHKQWQMSGVYSFRHWLTRLTLSLSLGKRTRHWVGIWRFSYDRHLSIYNAIWELC